MMGYMNILIVVAVLTQQGYGNHMFTSHIYKNLRKAVKGNLVFSPLAAETVLADLALAGAEGETKEEILDVLENPGREEQFANLTSHLYQSPNENITLASAYKVFISNEYQVNKTFISRSNKNFRVEVENVNFGDNRQVANSINSFVENNSKGKLKNLISPNQLGSADKIILVNAMYQSNYWKYPFNLQDTYEGTFETSSVETTRVTYLNQYRDFRIWHCGFLKVTYLELPFRYNNISMIIILPDDKDGIESVEERIFDVLEPHLTNFLKHVGPVLVRIPKFFISTELDFKPYLRDVNVERLFNPNEAQLPFVSNRRGLYVNSIPQKAIVNITELGNDHPTPEVPRLHLGPGPAISPNHIFEATHPFLFYIRDDISTLLLFVGRFNNK